MQLRKLVEYLEEIVPLEIQESYDNCGLILGNPDQEIHSGIVCLDITEEILEEAINKGANLVISHHPMIFKGIKKLNPAKKNDRIILSAIQNRIAIYALHTNLDKIWGGVSFQIGEILGLRDLEFLKLYSEKPPLPWNPDLVFSASNKKYQGLGAIGQLESSLPWDQFCNRIKEKMKAKVMRHSAATHKLIQKVGICGGSGSEFIQDALDQDCDIFITADVKYHQFFLDSTKMILVDIGHFETEQFSPELIRKIISNKFPTFNLSLTKLNTNPIYYSY